MKINESYSKKISFLMFISCICVIAYHCVGISINIEKSSIIDNFIYFILKVWYPLCQNFAMPFFLFMSGFLLYKNIDGTKENYKKEIKKRNKSLVIPFLTWNVIWTLFSIIISLIPFISSKINSLSVFNWTIKDFLLGVFMYKFNGV